MSKPSDTYQGIYERSLVSVNHLFEIENKCHCLDEQNESQTSTRIDGKDVSISTMHGPAKGVGLVRSQSFPPQGWYETTSKHILKISKTTLNLEDNDTLLINKVREEEETFCQGIRLPDLADASFDCVTPRMDEATEHQPDDASFVPDTSLSPISSVNSSSVGTSMVISLQSVGDAPTTITAGDDNSLHGGRSLLEPNVVDSASAIPRMPSINRRHIPALAFPPSGKLLVCGRRREMEDTAVIIPSFISVSCEELAGDETQSEKKIGLEWHFYGVFDGHGGSQASIYCMERLHHLIAEEFIKVSGDFKEGVGYKCNSVWVEAMKAAFLTMDKEVGGVCPNAAGQDEDNALDGGCLCCEDAIAPENVGTTAIVAVIGSCQIVAANCGDSRAVLARGGQAIPLSRDHKPEREDETTRIEAAGGRVICWDGYRVGGLLALSRAIGDRYLKRYVISEPEVTCIERSEDDECLILASDGLWDVVSNEFACEVARKSLAALRKKYGSRSSSAGEDAASAAAAALLVKLAYGRGSKDNISVVVVDLKSRESSDQS